MKTIPFVLALLCLSGAALAAASADGAPQLVSQHGAWKAYTFLENGGKACFMSSVPRKQDGKPTQRGPASLFVTHWPGGKDRNAVSISIGYTFKPGSPAALKVGGKSFPLITEGEMAWARDQAADDAIAAEIKKGAALEVRGVSDSGAEITDTYSLKGSGAALKAITSACAQVQ